jgi:hypothetical protein
MGTLKIAPATPPNQEVMWYRHKQTGALYRRGRDGLCIDPNGEIFSVGSIYDGDNMKKVFENTIYYEPLYPGTEITITL